MYKRQAEVSTTKFITVAAAPKPTRPNRLTNGDTAGFTWLQGVTHMMAASATT